MKTKWKKREPTRCGQVIKGIRLDNNLTQRELANILGVTQGTVSNWESGRVKTVLPYMWDIIKEEFGIDMERVVCDVR